MRKARGSSRRTRKSTMSFGSWIWSRRSRRPQEGRGGPGEEGAPAAGPARRSAATRGQEQVLPVQDRRPGAAVVPGGERREVAVERGDPLRVVGDVAVG